MNTLGVILARSGSKRIEDKNLQLVGGVPLLARAVKVVMGSSLGSPVVSSDSEAYLRMAERYGAMGVLRDPALAGDTSSSISVIRELLKWFPSVDSVFLINCCAPFVESKDIDAMLSIMEKTDCESVVSIVEAKDSHPSKLCRLHENSVLPLSDFRTAEANSLEAIYRRNAALYLAKRDVLEAGTFFGRDTIGYIMPKLRSIDINTEDDLYLARALYSYGEI